MVESVELALNPTPFLPPRGATLGTRAPALT